MDTECAITEVYGLVMKDMVVAVELAIQLSLLIFAIACMECFHFVFFHSYFSSKSEIFWRVFFFHGYVC